MTTNKKITIALIFIFALLTGLKVFNYLQSEESKIRKLIYAGKNYTEKKNTLRCLSLLDFDFSDNYGNDRATMGIIANAIFKRYEHIKIVINELSIEVDGDQAKASLIVEGIGKNINADNLEYTTLKFNIRFSKRENQWIVKNIEWIEPNTVFSPFIS
jgi:hypothetical protein